jgi:hypothetical protein
MKNFFVLGLTLLATACSSSTGGSGNFSTQVSASSDANNSSHAFDAQAATGDWSNASTPILTIVAIGGGGTQGLSMILRGAKPAAGVDYPVTANTDASGVSGSFQYGESTPSMTLAWRGTSGTIHVDAVSKDTVQVHFGNISASPDASASNNKATGTLAFDGEGTVTDVAGFTP